MLRLRALARRARDERGFTLTEVLVATLSSIAVVGALFAILEVALHQSARVADVAQATQAGRTAMTRIVDRLHSACLAPGFTPVQEGSNQNELILVSAYSEQAEIESARKDRIVWEPNVAGGALTDYTYASEGKWPKFTFVSTPSPVVGTRIGEHIGQAENEKKELLPIFKYYAYATKASSGSSTPSSTLNEAEPLVGNKGSGGGITAAEAATAASVLVSFRAAPSNANSTIGRTVDEGSQVTFSFSAPGSEAKIEAAPCQ